MWRWRHHVVWQGRSPTQIAPISHFSIPIAAQAWQQQEELEQTVLFGQMLLSAAVLIAALSGECPCDSECP
jgi:hypothetical protein